jgi:hypothetical protein
MHAWTEKNSSQTLKPLWHQGLSKNFALTSHLTNQLIQQLRCGGRREIGAASTISATSISGGDKLPYTQIILFSTPAKEAPVC